MKNNLLILGAGEFGHVVKEIAEDIGKFDKIDFLDDFASSAIGRFDEIEKFKAEYKNAVVALGNADLREKLVEKLKTAGYNVITAVSPKAYVSKSAKIGCNTVIEPFAVVNVDSEIGDGTFICAGAIVNHNVKIGGCCTLQCGSIVPANASVSSKTTLAYGEVFAKA